VSAQSRWPVVVTALTVAAVLVLLAGAGPALRAPVVLAFALVGPGMALVPLLRLDDPLAELSLGVALSLALDTLVALAMLYAGAWSPEGALLALAAMSLAGVAAQRRRAEAAT